MQKKEKKEKKRKKHKKKHVYCVLLVQFTIVNVGFMLFLKKT